MKIQNKIHNIVKYLAIIPALMFMALVNAEQHNTEQKNAQQKSTEKKEVITTKTNTSFELSDCAKKSGLNYMQQKRKQENKTVKEKSYLDRAFNTRAAHYSKQEKLTVLKEECPLIAKK